MIKMLQGKLYLRIKDYILLILILSGFSVFGLVSLNCASTIFDYAFVIEEVERRLVFGGCRFDRPNTEQQTSTLEVPQTLEEEDGTESDVYYKCFAIKNNSGKLEFIGAFNNEDIQIKHPHEVDSSQNSYVLRCNGFVYDELYDRETLRVAVIVPVIYEND